LVKVFLSGTGFTAPFADGFWIAVTNSQFEHVSRELSKWGRLISFILVLAAEGLAAIAS